MPGVTTTFASMSGNVAASELDDAFAEAARLTDLDALTAAVETLPSDETPLIPVSGGEPGINSDLARSDHQHPPQSATINLQLGTSYTVSVSDDGKVVELSNASSISVTVPASLPAGFNCLFTQVGAGQATFSPGSGATQRQRSEFDKTSGQWAVCSLYVRANSGGSAAEYVMSGDMI